MEMGKAALPKAMQWELPMRTPDIGRLKYNVKSALEKEFHQSDSFKLVLEELYEKLEAPNQPDMSTFLLENSDGFRLQLLAFKLNELNAVKYRRLPPHKLPLRIATTLDGTDYFLPEIGHIAKIKQDVSGLWGCDLNQIKIFGLGPRTSLYN
ncbi:hypothetical protein BGZ98_003488 [Dissophora globulifera]|nr:hypothetical protein BGZ98_003488 [Dissophora globulifera]